MKFCQIKTFFSESFLVLSREKEVFIENRNRYLKPFIGGMIMTKPIMKSHVVLNRLSKLETELELLEKKLIKVMKNSRNEIIEERKNSIGKLERELGEILDEYFRPINYEKKVV